MANTLDDLLQVARELRDDVRKGVTHAVSAGAPSVPGATVATTVSTPATAPAAVAPPALPMPQAPAGLSLIQAGLSKLSNQLADILWQVSAIRAQPIAPAPRQPAQPKTTPPPPSTGSQVLQGLAKGPAAVLVLFGAVERALSSFGAQLSRFVSLANPAAVQRLNLVMADMQAVVGRALVPVLERVTLIVRKMADAFASLSPLAQRFIAGAAAGAGLALVVSGITVAVKALLASFGPLPLIIGAVASALIGVAGSMASGEQIGKAFSGVLRAVGTVIEVLARAVIPLVEGVVTPALEALANAFGWLAKQIQSFLSFLGLVDEYEPEKKSSVGAAVRQAQFSDLSSFASRQYQSAYQGASSDIPRAQLGELKGIRSGIDGLPDRLADRLNPITPGTPGTGTQRDKGRRIVGSAAAGAAIGSVVPVIGTGLGAAVGGLVGIMRELF